MTIQYFLQNKTKTMYVLITYDVNTSTKEGQRRLRHVAKCCKNYGQRVQNSVFECLITEAQLVQIRHILTSIIDDKHDSIRIYRLGKNYNTKIEHIGITTSYDMEGELII